MDTGMIIKIKKSQRNLVTEEILRQLSEYASDLRPSDLDWSIKLEDSYKEHGVLSDKELGIIMEILTRVKNANP